MPTLDAPSLRDGDDTRREWPHLAALRVSPTDGARGVGAGTAEDWIATCYRLTARVERMGLWGALLDLGICADAEALAAMRTLQEKLAAFGLEARVGVGPSAGLAQLAGLTCAVARPVTLLAPPAVPAFLRCVPVGALLRLDPPGAFTPEVVERLQRYGLRTLGHVARIGELALRRQFGAAGSFLAALTQGRDARPFCPTPPPEQLRIRQRFIEPASPEETLGLVPHLAAGVAARLRMQGRQARALRLVVRWECGGIERSHLTLRCYTDSSTLLAQELRRMLVPLFASHLPTARPHEVDIPATSEDMEGDSRDRSDRIEELGLTLADFAATIPSQATFWRARRQRTAALEEVAQTLLRRHGRPLLVLSEARTPAAIFSEDRHALVPLDFAPLDAPRRDALSATGTEGMSMREASGPAIRSTRAETSISASPYGSALGHRAWQHEAWRDVPQRLHWW